MKRLKRWLKNIHSKLQYKNKQRDGVKIQFKIYNYSKPKKQINKHNKPR